MQPRLALARPHAALTGWVVAVLVLGILGLGVGDRLAVSGLNVKGSESAKARDLVGAQFDDGATVPVLLQGPRAAVKTQGRRLAATLGRREGVQVLSPWTKSAGRTPLRPSGDRALLLLSLTGSSPRTAAETERIERVVDRMVSAPVTSTVTGLPSLTKDGEQASLNAMHRAELIAIPLLLLSLLLVFRSPLAAALPAVFGGATIFAGSGALYLLAGIVRLDAFALALSSMMGLALAVDYSLLMVSRLRDERAADPDGDPLDAIARAASPTAHTVVAAAAAIVGAMAVAAVLSPGTAVLSAALGVAVVAVLSAVGVFVAVPAALVLLSGHLDRLAPTGGSGRGPGVSARLAGAALRRPGLGLAALALLLVASIPAFGLSTSLPGASSLPDGSKARADSEKISGAMGQGWAEPFELVAITRGGTVTTSERLTAMERIQRDVARDPAVRAVLGPGTLAADARRLRSSSRKAVRAATSSPGSGRLKSVQGDVTSAATGVTALRGALTDATSAASKIEGGSKDVKGGVEALRSGLQGAQGGAQRLVGRLRSASEGARALAGDAGASRDALRTLRDDALAVDGRLGQVKSGAKDLRSRLYRRGESLDRARTAIRSQRQRADAALTTALGSLPRYGSANARRAIADARTLLSLDAAAVLDDPLKSLEQDAQYASALAKATPREPAAALASSARELFGDAEALQERLRGLGGSVRELSGGTGALASAMTRLDGGAGRLGEAFGAVSSGVSGLTAGVERGSDQTRDLDQGLRSAGDAVAGLGDQAASASEKTGGKGKAATPGFFDSGYFLLAALEGRAAASSPFGVNVDRGGQGARIVVVPRYGAQDPRTAALYERLRATADTLGTALDARAAVGGPAALLADYDAAADRRLPLIVLVLALVTAGLLGVMLRSVVVPLIGVVLNLLAVGATLGLMSLLFEGSDPLLGGPGSIDAVALTAIFGVVFALSIDYQVFIVARIREEWLAHGDDVRAVQDGLARTARVVTGAALSMLGVFGAFALADVASLRQFGVGLAIAVVIDATLVRLVLLPALLRLAGPWAWWLPGQGTRSMRSSSGTATGVPAIDVST